MLALALSVAAHGYALHAVLADASRQVATDPPPIHTVPQTGETFDVPALEETPSEARAASAATEDTDDRDPSSEASEAAGAVGQSVPPRPGHVSASRRGLASPRPSVASSRGDAPRPFGAVGDRSAVDVATAFTRGFPQAASADPAWQGALFGDAGSVDVTIVIDENGVLLDAHVQSGGGHGPSREPGPALSAGVRRTLALIRARTFVATGRETRLHVSATVSPDQVHDGLHGDVFAIGGSWGGGDGRGASSAGSGFFALASGRRIDVHVECASH